MYANFSESYTKFWNDIYLEKKNVVREQKSYQEESCFYNKKNFDKSSLNTCRWLLKNYTHTVDKNLINILCCACQPIYLFSEY